MKRKEKKKKMHKNLESRRYFQDGWKGSDTMLVNMTSLEN
jgi:hypothetical protein